MKSNRAALFFFVQKSHLVFSEKSELSSKIFDLSEEQARTVCEQVDFSKEDEDIVKQIGKLFGFADLHFGKINPSRHDP